MSSLGSAAAILWASARLEGDALRAMEMSLAICATFAITAGFVTLILRRYVTLRCHLFIITIAGYGGGIVGVAKTVGLEGILPMRCGIQAIGLDAFTENIDLYATTLLTVLIGFVSLRAFKRF